MEFRTSSC